MAKELPYFKFEPNEWQSGMIQLCSLQSKGLFLELCCLYWSRLGELPYALALQKLCMGNTDLLQELEKNGIYDIEDEKIIIKFLDEQLNEFKKTSKKRSEAANKRWNNANAMQVHSKSNAIREDKIKEDKIKENKEDEEKFFDNDINFKMYLENDKLVNAIISNKKNKIGTKEYLIKRLKEFNQSLQEVGVFAKSQKDYQQHFRNWHLKRLHKPNNKTSNNGLTYKMVDGKKIYNVL